MHFPAADLDLVAAETFGRQATMFHNLLSFMASVSWVLWALVLLTLVVRFLAGHVVYRRRRAVSDALPVPARPVLAGASAIALPADSSPVIPAPRTSEEDAQH